MNKPGIFLRIAAGFTLIHAVLHTIGGVFGTPGPGAEALAVAAMKTNQFLWMGHVRSYWDFHLGMGLAVSIFLTAEAIVFWLFASLTKMDAVRLRPIVAIFLVAYLALAVNSYTYFFLGAAIVEILIALCMAGVIFTAKQDNKMQLNQAQRK
jgi:hypothetical protein